MQFEENSESSCVVAGIGADRRCFPTFGFRNRTGTDGGSFVTGNAAASIGVTSGRNSS